VRDSCNFRSLCDVVAAFDEKSPKHKKLAEEIIPRLVSIDDGRENLISALNASPLKIKYASLVGTAFTPRSASSCNGIALAAVKGQKRDFIAYYHAEDSFGITPSGLSLTAAYSGQIELSEEERILLTDALLSYPPVIRILEAT
jgi:hypothetical protein